MIIQTTSIGMVPEVDFSPLSLENLQSQALVSDIIYNPLKTQFLKDAATTEQQFKMELICLCIKEHSPLKNGRVFFLIQKE